MSALNWIKIKKNDHHGKKPNRMIPGSAMIEANVTEWTNLNK